MGSEMCIRDRREREGGTDRDASREQKERKKEGEIERESSLRGTTS